MREAQIKQALAKHLAQSSGSSPKACLEELELSGGQVRADFVDVVDMHCYEIKSDHDSLARLIGQGAKYARVFDRVTLVAAKRHIEKALPMLPVWWGVLVVPQSIDLEFKQLRIAKPNRMLDQRVLVTVLNRTECLSLLDGLGLARGWKSKSLYQIQAHIAESLPLDSIRAHVRQSLLIRQQSRVFN